jgi:hypothetical protein
MPIPQRRKDEDKTKFVSRCMGDKVMKKDYPNNQQRIAICLDQATADCDCVEIADFELQMEAGYAEEINEENFYIPAEAEYVDFDEEVEEYNIAGEKPGLWDNIRKKKEREGKNYKPAKPGDPDRPDPKSWKKAQSNGDSEMAIEQIQKMNDQLVEMVTRMKSMSIPVEFQDWTKDMISKAEIYIQNVYDFVKYYEPGKYEDEYTTEPENMQTEGAENPKVKLNKPFRTPSGPKKFSVYVKNDKGNVVKVNFGDPNMEIKRDDPERRKSYRARHNCDNPGPKWKANYWSCKMWSKTNVSDLT